MLDIQKPCQTARFFRFVGYVFLIEQKLFVAGKKIGKSNRIVVCNCFHFIATFKFWHCPHVSMPAFSAHCLMGHKKSQYGVFAPCTRHPWQFIMDGVISTPFNLLHSTATFSPKASSSLIVAIRASHFRNQARKTLRICQFAFP